MSEDKRQDRRQHNRADPIDAILARALAAASGDLTQEGARDDCPDAALIAGWYDRSLEHAAAGRVEEHLAGCARCRMIVAALARADDAAAAPMAYARGGWRWIFSPRLAVPVLTGAIAILAVAVVFVERGRAPMQVAQIQVAQVSQAPRAAKALEVPRAAANLAPSTPPGESAQALAMNQPALRAFAGRTAAAGGAISNSSAHLPRMAATEPRVAASGNMSRAMVAKAPGLPAGTIGVVAPDRSSSWAIGRDGAIFHVDPTGAVSSQSSGVTADLTAGAAVSTRVCWIVGKAGTILRTTDGGAHWSQVSSPVAADLRAIKASSSNDAVAIDASGNRYVTSDAGATWSRR
ncbi:MAG: YCF48-related protein [Candidatus Binataceae bacterium]